jgi:Na+-transporting methylmalonyl-CoA/oxaloacetate decarboxylase gamma subunit
MAILYPEVFLLILPWLMWAVKKVAGQLRQRAKGAAETREKVRPQVPLKFAWSKTISVRDMA